MFRASLRAVRKSSGEVKTKLRMFLDKNEPQLVKILQTLWQNQGKAITYKEIREAILSGEFAHEGEIAGGYAEKWLNAWRQDYSKFVIEQMLPEWEKAIKAGANNIPDFFPRFYYQAHSEWYFNPSAEGVRNWMQTHGAAFVTNSTQTQIKGLRAVIRYAGLTGMNVDELSYVVRPMVGLTYQQGQANIKYYNTLRENGLSEKKALEKSILYGQRQHRYRGYNIARTELAFAYNHGAIEGVRQAQKLGYIGAVEKYWITADDERTCGICEGLNNTPLGLDGEFDFYTRLTEPGIHETPPAHPSCRCAIGFREISPPNISGFAPQPDIGRFDEIEELPSNQNTSTESGNPQIVNIEVLGEDEQAESGPKPLTNAAGKRIIPVDHVVVKNGPPNGITQRTNKNGGIDRNYYDADGRQIKQISNNGHNHPDEEKLGKHGEHAHDYIWDNSGKMDRQDARELSPDEREENGDMI